MSEWDHLELGEILTIKYGKDHKRLGEGHIPCFGSGGIMRFVDAQLSTKPSVLIPRKGSLNNIFFVDRPFWTVDTLFWTQIDEERAHPKFTYYKALTIDWESMNVGSAVPSLTSAIISGVQIALPSLIEQEAIAEVLSSLDDKIDLLKRQNKTLEGMAEALFRQWFIEEAQEDWEDVEISDVFSIERGLSYKGAGLTSSEDPNGVPMFNLNSVLEFGGYKEEGIKFYNGAHKERHVVHPGDILVANTEQGHDHRLIGFPCIVPTKFKKGILSHHLYKLTPKAELGGHFMHQLLKTFAVRGQVEGCTNGSTVNMLLIDLFGRVSFKRPPEEIHDAFDEQASALHQRKEKNWASIETLVKQRDTLLHKLMSGEVRVQMD